MANIDRRGNVDIGADRAVRRGPQIITHIFHDFGHVFIIGVVRRYGRDRANNRNGCGSGKAGAKSGIDGTTCAAAAELVSAIRRNVDRPIAGRQNAGPDNQNPLLTKLDAAAVFTKDL